MTELVLILSPEQSLVAVAVLVLLAVVLTHVHIWVCLALVMRWTRRGGRLAPLSGLPGLTGRRTHPAEDPDEEEPDDYIA